MHHKYFLLFGFLLFVISVKAQNKETVKSIRPWMSDNVFKTDCIIENKGQFTRQQLHAKDVQYAIQNKGEDFYFTNTGYSTRLLKKQLKKGQRAKGADEKALEKELGIKLIQQKESKKYETKEDWLDMVWIGSNENVKIIAEEKTSHYYTYGTANYNSYGFKKITYKNLYDGIDVVYEVHPDWGMEYTLIIKPGADLSKVKYKYVGNSVNIEKDKEGLIINNSIKPLYEKNIYAYYASNPQQPIKIEFKVEKNVVSFNPTTLLDPTQTLVIDPWVSTITTLTGIGLADDNGFDVDFDLAGNLYVLGGGGGTAFEPKVAKYDALGNLLWTFSGVLITPSWISYGSVTDYIGNFIVEKASGKVYIGQGWTPGTGATICRLNTLGVYDNYLSIANNNLEEVWEMKFNCNTGQLIAMGGSTSANTNFGIVDTTTGASLLSSVTGAAGSNQDVVSGTINDAGEAFLLFNSFVSNVDNNIYKLNAAYTTALWNVPSGYNNLTYNQNKNYAGLSSMGHNALHVNNTYLFYYDGGNIKAFDPITGAVVGTPLNIGTSVQTQGGIYVNNCGELFLGGVGQILRYNFNGTTFTAQPSIPIVGANAVHDITLNPINNTLYVSGQGFVATVLPGTACLPPTSGAIALSVDVDCPNVGIINVTNATAGNSYTYIWQDSISGTILQVHQSPVGVFSDTFSNMMLDSIYKVIVIQSAACQVISNFAYINGSCSDTNIYLCAGQTFTMSNGTILTLPGTYTDTFTNILGLDSIITINVFAGEDTLIINQNLCPNASYVLPNGAITTIGGTYTFSGVNAYGCDSTTIVNLFQKPITFSSNVVNICVNTTYTLPDGTVTGAAGVYLDTFVNANGCDSIVTTTINVITVPYTIINDTTYCTPGVQIPLIASGGNTIAWTSSAGALGCPTCYNQIVNPAGSIDYYAEITNGIGCKVTDTVKVRIYPFTMFLNVSNQNICEGQAISLSSQIIGAGTSGTINYGNGTIVNQTPLIQYTYTTPGTYTITLIGKDTLACSDTITRVMNVFGKNNLNFTIADTIICVGEPVIITDAISTNVLDFTYNMGDEKTFSNVHNPIYTYQEKGDYIIQLTGENPRCPDSVLKKNVSVKDFPIVNLGPDTTFCAGLTAPLKLESKQPVNAQRYLWNNGDTISFINIAEANTYWLQANNFNCIASDTIVVQRDCYINIPNAFTPGSTDALNAYFFPRDILSKGVTAFSMNIFNRWGNEVFNTTNINGRGWDGLYGGKPQPMGVYIYNMSVVFKNGERKTYTGNVTLLR
jgi:gliding motility-associated-like protein